MLHRSARNILVLKEKSKTTCASENRHVSAPSLFHKRVCAPRIADSVPLTRSTFHRRAQRNVFRRRDVRQQSRVFAIPEPQLKRSRSTLYRRAKARNGRAKAQNGRPQERPLCFSSFARTGTLCWLNFSENATPCLRHRGAGASSDFKDTPNVQSTSLFCLCERHVRIALTRQIREPDVARTPRGGSTCLLGVRM